MYRVPPRAVWHRALGHSRLRIPPAHPGPLPPREREVVLRPPLGVHGKIKPDTPPMSFQNAVEEYKQEYRRRYEGFLRTGVRPS